MASIGNFPDWLNAELAARSMRPAELSRLANLDKGVLSRILNGERKPANETILAIARALKLPPETVFAAAGVYKPTYTRGEDDRDPTLLEWIKLFKDADEAEREEMINQARYMAERAMKRRTVEK